MTERSTLSLTTPAANQPVVVPGTTVALDKVRVRFDIPAGSEFLDGRIKVPFGENLTLVIAGTSLAKLNLRHGVTVDGALTVRRSKKKAWAIKSAELVVEDGPEPTVQLKQGRTDTGAWRKPILGNGYLCLEQILVIATPAQVQEQVGEPLQLAA